MIKRHMRILSIILLVILIMPAMAQANSDRTNRKVDRLKGSNRIGTAIAISRAAYKTADKVVLVGYHGEVDALTGTLFAQRKKAPLLISGDKNLDPMVKEELSRLGTKEVFILGGTNAVNENIEKELENMKLKVKRISGKNREDTAVQLAKESLGEGVKEGFLALGYDAYADALAVGPISAKLGQPILLTQSNSIRDLTLDYIKESGMKKITIIGGERAVSEGVEAKLKSQGLAVNRIKGSNRENTALALAETYVKNPSNIVISNGYTYADALAGGYFAYMKNAPILLSRLDGIAEENLNYIRSRKLDTYILGGDKVVGDKIFTRVRNIITDSELRVVMDYGHGGSDPGAVYKGRQEKDDTLRLGKKITKNLRKKGVVVDETRTGDYRVELGERSSYANRHGKYYYDYFVSIHRNSFHSTEANGSETFTYTTKNPLSVALASEIQKGLTQIGFRDRGVKHANFHVLRETFAPAVLVEVGFIGNKKDNQLFDTKIDEIAESIANSIWISLNK